MNPFLLAACAVLTFLAALALYAGAVMAANDLRNGLRGEARINVGIGGVLAVVALAVAGALFHLARLHP